MESLQSTSGPFGSTNSGSEALAAHVLNAVRHPLLVLGTDLSVRSANVPFYRTFSTVPETTIGQYVYRLGNGQWDIPELRELLEAVIPTEQWVDDFEVEHEFEDIGHRTMLVSARLIVDSDLILLAIEDVTDKRQAQVAVARALEQAEKTIDTVREPMLVLDHDLRIRSANQSFYQVFDVEEEATLGQIVYDIGEGQWDIPALRSLLEDVLPDNNLFNNFVVDHHFPNLGRRTMLLNARRIDHVQLVLLAFEDITERMRAAADLTASESRFRALFEQTSAGISEIDPSSGRLLSANETLCRMHGKMASELVGRTMSELTHADDNQAIGPIFQRVLHGDVTSAQVDKRLLRNDGSYLWVHETLNLIRDESGRPIRAMGIAIDITDRKDAEAAMHQALKAKDEFLGLISHELRTPLTVIQGYASLFSRGIPVDQQTETEAFQDIRTESGRLARIIENMLYLARLDVGKEPEFEPVSIRRVFEEHVTDFLQRRPEADVVLAEINPDAIVLGNREYIYQILENLLSNALKYSPVGAPIEVSAQVSGEFVQAAVADRGIGLKGSDSQLFEPFYRESEVVSGLGIGLAVCRRLVEAQHGQIQASARNGGGSIFSFTLPLAAPVQT